MPRKIMQPIFLRKIINTLLFEWQYHKGHTYAECKFPTSKINSLSRLSYTLFANLPTKLLARINICFPSSWEQDNVFILYNTLPYSQTSTNVIVPYNRARNTFMLYISELF